MNRFLIYLGSVKTAMDLKCARCNSEMKPIYNKRNRRKNEIVSATYYCGCCGSFAELRNDGCVTWLDKNDNIIHSSHDGINAISHFLNKID